MTYSHCPKCGGTHMKEKTVKQVLQAGHHAALVEAPATVCLDCGERLYAVDVCRKFEEIRARLERDKTTGFHPVGQLFQVA